MRNKDIAAELDVGRVQAERWHERYADRALQELSAIRRVVRLRAR